MTLLHTPRRATLFGAGRLGLIALVPALVLAAACGSSSGDDSSTDTTSAEAVQFPSNPATGSTIKIGVINAEGGPAISQPNNRLATDAAAAYANDALGGIAGHKIELVHCANKEDPASARDCANQMVEAGVAAVVVTTTAQGDSIVPVVTGAGIPYLSTSGGSSAEVSTANTFMLTSGFPGTLAAMADYAAGNDIGKVAVFATDSSSVIPALKALGTPAFDAAGVELQTVPIPLGTPDATPQVSSGLSGDPDAIAIIGDATVCTSVLKALGTLGAAQQKMLIQPCLDPSTVSAVGSALDGSAVFTTADIVTDDPEAKLYRDIMATYEPDADIGGYTSVGYQGMLGLIRLAQGLQGDPTPAAVSAALSSAKDVPLPAGHGITLTCDRTVSPILPSVCSDKLITVTVQDGVGVDAKVVE